MKIWHLSLVLGISVLAGCGSTYTVFRENLRIALQDPVPVSYSEQSVRTNPYDLVSLRIGEQPEAVLALAFAEHGQLKYISADSALLTFQHGRIVKTSGFNSDLAYTSALSADPLQYGAALLADNVSWLRLTDWPDEDAYGYQFESVFNFAGREMITIFDRQIAAVKVVEKVTIEQADVTLENRYWFAVDGGTLLKSEQQPAPFWPIVHITYLSQVARHFQR